LRSRLSSGRRRNTRGDAILKEAQQRRRRNTEGDAILKEAQQASLRLRRQAKSDRHESGEATARRRDAVISVHGDRAQPESSDALLIRALLARRCFLNGARPGVCGLTAGRTPHSLRQSTPGLTRPKRHSASTLCTSWMQTEPSPTAAATRLRLPARTSPTAKTPGRFVSKRCGGRRSGHRDAMRSEGRRSEPAFTKPF